MDCLLSQATSLCASLTARVLEDGPPAWPPITPQPYFQGCTGRNYPYSKRVPSFPLPLPLLVQTSGLTCLIVAAVYFPASKICLLLGRHHTETKVIFKKLQTCVPVWLKSPQWFPLSSESNPSSFAQPGVSCLTMAFQHHPPGPSPLCSSGVRTHQS